MHRRALLTDRWGNPIPTATRAAHVALRQGGAISTRQLDTLGADSRLIGAWVRDGWLIRVHQQSYRLAGHPPNDRGRAFAALHAYGPRAVLSGRSAAFAHGLISDLGPKVHLTLATSRRPRRGVIPHRAALARGDLVRVNDLPTTRVPRLLVDLATTGPSTLLPVVIRKAGELGKLDLGETDAALARLAGHVGVPAVRQALARRDPNRGHTRSSLEVACSEFLLEHGFPPAERNVLVSIGGEEFTLADFVWPWALCCLEMDHRSSHDHPERFDEDRRISRRLQAGGWSTPRATGVDMDEPTRRTELAADLWAILDRAARRLAES